jgi:anti-sigma factor RsiW
MTEPANCDEFEALIQEYYDATAPAGALRAVESHAARCQRCAEALARQGWLDQLLAATLRPPVLRADFASLILRRPGPLPSPAWTSWLDLAAAAGVAAAVGLSLPHVWKAMASLTMSSASSPYWAVTGAAIAAALWFAFDALSDIRLPSR